MAKFTALLRPENIRQGVICSSKKTALEMVAGILAKQANVDNVDEVECFESLFNREKLGCTALGNGIAMPRARLSQGDKVFAVFLQLNTPIDYEAADKREVDLILAVIIPEQLCQTYTPILVELSEKLKDKTLDKQLRSAQSAEEIWQIFQHFDDHKQENTDSTT
ncbi:PTS IIA-like nitrogen regulatory protein PtsN [Lonepinella sp. BR2919]|uniref:PTS IIA-like nitrogen regulatory protein PtsN n=1 Tax=unclassified Lonepinella TaxID=2642006 RepID=UPI003F6DA81A